MRIVVVGNSHASAIQLALRAGWGRDGLSVDVVAVPGRAQPRARLEGGRVYPLGDLTRLRSTIPRVAAIGIDPAAYDGVLFVGYGINGPNPTSLTDGSHLLSRVQGAAWSNAASGVPLVSGAVLAELIRLELAELGFVTAFEAFHAAGHPRMFISPRPRPSRLVLTHAVALMTRLFATSAQAAIGGFLDLHDDVATAFAAALAPSARMLPQDARTRDGILTRPRFAQRKNDFLHMDARYGAIVLDQMHAALAGTRPPAHVGTASNNASLIPHEN